MAQDEITLEEIGLTGDVPMDDTTVVPESQRDEFERLYLRIENERLVSNVVDGLLYNCALIRDAIRRPHQKRK